MKLLIFSTLCFISAYAFAQVPNKKNPWTFQFPDTSRKFKGNNDEKLKRQMQQYMERRQNRNELLSNRQDNIVLLPQDRMPCVIPDTNAIAKMPNAWAEVTVPYKPESRPIPNPALPPQSFRYNALDNSIGVPSK